MSASPGSGTVPGAGVAPGVQAAGAPPGRSMMEIIRALLLKNRTIVSGDVEDCMLLLSEELPM